MAKRGCKIELPKEDITIAGWQNIFDQAFEAHVRLNEQMSPGLTLYRENVKAVIMHDITTNKFHLSTYYRTEDLDHDNRS